MRILICGDRNWTDREIISQELKKFKAEEDTIIHGGARGADSLAGWEATHLGFRVCEFYAQWKIYGKAAGPIRNKQMLKEGKPDLVIAFHDDLAFSKGTRNMVMLARAAGVKVEVKSHKHG